MEPLTPAIRSDLALDITTVSARTALAAQHLDHAARTLTIDQYRDMIADRVVFTVRAHLAVERLPEQRLPFTVTGTQDIPTWATWWDHLKATYRQRWWARWWIARHPPRHRWTEARVTQRITVPVRAAWKFPHVPHLPAECGRVYLHTWTDPAVVEWSSDRDTPGGS